MLFNSWTFVIFMAVTTIIYYLKANSRYQVTILLIASFVFYAFSSLPLILLLFGTAMINALASYYVAFGKNKKTIAAAGVAVNIALLAVFKYSGMVASLFDTDHGAGAFLISIPLPLGISFYTFRGISLLVDVYKGTADDSNAIAGRSLPEHLYKTLFFISFFPALVAGPIVKARDFYSQIKTKHISDIPFEYVVKTLITGYFLKMVVADNLGKFTFWMTYPYFESKGSGDLFLMLIGYSAQIFADFAGYSLIAIGIGAVLGYKLPDNFRFPYISMTIREFWKRWHITLSQFLMEYLYFSMGGSRRGKKRTYLNLFLTMTIGGLWHGAALSYIVWGMYHGLLLVVERIACGKREHMIEIGSCRRLSVFLSITAVYLLVSLGWLLFALPDFSAAVDYLACMASPCRGVPLFSPFILPIAVYILPVLLYHLIYYFRDTRLVQRSVFRYSYVVYGFMLYLVITNSAGSESFVYFQF